MSKAMNIHEIKQEIEEKGSIQVPSRFASTVMQEAENHLKGSVRWDFKMRGGVCTISRPQCRCDDVHGNEDGSLLQRSRA